jgi:hypothetical protein
MATAAKPLRDTLHEMTASEVAEIFDIAARRLLRMSGKEFVEKWNSGYFGPDPDTQPGVMEVASLMPSV